MRRKLFSILLSVAMVMVMMPSMAFADTHVGTAEDPIPVSTLEELQTALTNAGAAGSGDTTISIKDNIELKETDSWTSVGVDGAHGAGVITIEGNNNTITGLNAPLFSGGFAGKSGLVINNLKLSRVVIKDTTERQGLGAFVSCVDSMTRITLNNCHLVDSTIESTGEARVGGLIGWASGYNNVNDGPVDTYVNITNCTVKNTEITASGSVGAIIGHAGANPATFHNISDCEIEKCTLTSTDGGDWRVGTVVGTVNSGQVSIENLTESENTIAQTGKTAPNHSKLYGRLVSNGTGILCIDGTLVDDSAPTVAKIGGRFYERFADALKATNAGDTIKLLDNITVDQKIEIGKAITIDGGNKTISTNKEDFADHLMLITSNATIKNVTLDSNNLAKGVNTYAENKSLNITFENVNMTKSAGNGLTAKGGDITLKNVAISESAWKQSVDISPSPSLEADNSANLIIDNKCAFGDDLKIVSDNPTVKSGRVDAAAGSSDLIIKHEDLTKDWSNEGGEEYTKRVFYVTKYVAPTTPPTPVEKDPVSNEGTAGTDNATTSADITDKVTTTEGKTEAVVDQTVADKIVDKAVENKSTEVVVEATTTAGTSDASQVTLPESTVKAIAEKTDAAITIKTDNATVTLDKEAVAAVADKAGTEGTVKLVVETVEATTEQVVVELKLETSNGYVSDFKGGNVSVTVPVNKELAGKKVVCVYIDDNGNYTKVDGQLNEDGTYTFTTGHFSTYAIMSEEEADAVIKDQTAAAQKAAIKNVKATVTLSTKEVKKGIRVTVKVPVDQKADKTGIIIYRSTSKNAKPYAVYKKVATKGSTYIIRNYYNVKGNRLVKGKTYYYKARAYKVIDGKTYYGPMSTIKSIKAK